MRRKCKHCKSKVGERYRINGKGDIFCDDDCYEQYRPENEDKPDDFNHPYIDDYEAIRYEYLEFLDFEDWIMSPKYGENLQYKVDELLDSIDSVQWEFFEYFYREGDDGIFAYEIYNYYLKMEDLKERILRWKPYREVFFYLKIKCTRGAFPEAIDKWYQFEDFLKQMGLNKLRRLLKNNVFKGEEMAFYFYSNTTLNPVLKELKKHFNEEQIHLTIREAYPCHGCGEVKPVKARDKRKTGWFFCQPCANKYEPGFFTKEELFDEIQQCDQDDNFVKRSISSVWPYYLRKIKRSCRYHHVDYPEWIELKYD